MESSGPKRPDRKTVERNRRIRMKMLYSQLHSLVPLTRASRESGSISLPDRLDGTVNYIKQLQEEIERMKNKKRQLLGNGTARLSQGTSSSTREGAMRLPHIEVQHLGMGLQVTITSSSADWFVFKEAIRISLDEGFEIASANFSVVADRALHIIHLHVEALERVQEAPKLLERLKKEIHQLS